MTRKLVALAVVGESATVEVEAGLLAEVELRLRAGVLREIEIAYPEPASLGSMHLRIVEQSGALLTEFDDTRPAGPTGARCAFRSAASRSARSRAAASPARSSSS